MRLPQPPLPPLDTRQSAGWNNSRVDFVYDFPLITVDSGLATDSLKFLSKLDNNTGKQSRSGWAGGGGRMQPKGCLWVGVP